LAFYVNIVALDSGRELSSVKNFKNFPRIATFITDPPYTLNGVLAFINVGLNMLAHGGVKEFM